MSLSLAELLKQWEEWAVFERAAAGIAANAGDSRGAAEGLGRADAIDTCRASVLEFFRLPSGAHRN